MAHGFRMGNVDCTYPLCHQKTEKTASVLTYGEGRIMREMANDTHPSEEVYFVCKRGEDGNHDDVEYILLNI
jgi:hypothetical protein